MVTNLSIKKILRAFIFFELLITLYQPEDERTAQEKMSNGVSYQVKGVQFNKAGNASIHASVTMIRSADAVAGINFLVKEGDIETIFDGRFGFVIDNQQLSVKQLAVSELIKERTYNYIFKDLLWEIASNSSTNDSLINVENYAAYKVVTRVNALYTKKIFLHRLTDAPFKIEIKFNRVKAGGIAQLLVSDIRFDPVPKQFIESKLNALLNTHTLLPIDDSSNQETPQYSLVGSKAVNFCLDDFTGKKYCLTDFVGKVVLLNFWETWCGPCRMSLSYLDNFFQKNKTQELVILNLTKDNVPFSKKIVADRKIELPNLISSIKVNESYSVSVIPQYVLIDRDGTIVHASSGEYRRDMEKKILQLINKN